MALNRDRIVQAALRLLDEVGLEPLSLRRLASDLGVHASALYWHFRDKQELLDEMAQAVAAAVPATQMPRAGALAWDGLLTFTARAWRQAMLSRRDGALLLTAARPAGYQLAVLEQLLDQLVTAGFSPADAMRGFFTVTNYVLGAVLEEQRGSHDEPDELPGAFRLSPALSAARAAVLDRDAMFEHGLSLILDGMRAQLVAATHASG
jgi:TetR/AcrR family tetracycline transcriptional repressor